MSGQVFFDITTSLDGFVAGPNDSLDNPLGIGGEKLHDWIFGLASWREPHGLEGGEGGPDSDLLDEATTRSGAVIVGRRMFDLARGWGDDPPFRKPVFVLTHRAGERLRRRVERRSRSSRTGSRVRSSRRVPPPAAWTSRSEAAPRRSSSTWPPGTSTSSRSTWRRCCSAAEFASSSKPPALGLELAGVIESPRVTHLKYRVVK